MRTGRCVCRVRCDRLMGTWTRFRLTLCRHRAQKLMTAQISNYDTEGWEVRAERAQEHPCCCAHPLPPCCSVPR